MAQINLVDEIIKHDDAEIIEFLAEEVGRIRMATTYAVENQSPEYMYAVKGNIEVINGVLRELNRRNKEKAL